MAAEEVRTSFYSILYDIAQGDAFLFAAMFFFFKLEKI